MLNIKTSSANGSDSRSVAQDAAGSIQQSGIKLVLFFCSTAYDFQIVSKTFKDNFPTAEVVGCTTTGEVGLKGFVEGSISATSIAADNFQVVTCVMKDIKLKSALSKNELISKAAKVGISPSDTKYGFVMTLIDGLQGAEEKVMSVIGDCFPTLPIVGGSAGDDLKFKETFVSLNGKVYKDAATVTFVRTSKKFLIHKENIYVPTDKELRVTKANVGARTVIEFNGRPAAEEYAKLLGVSVKDLPNYFMSNPIGRVNGNEIWITSPKEINPDHSMSFYAMITQNSTAKILKAVDAVSEARKTVQVIKEKVPNCKGLILFNCIFRFLQFKKENICSAMANEYSKAGEYCGFSTYGEQMDYEHVNQTLTLIAFGEDREAEKYYKPVVEDSMNGYTVNSYDEKKYEEDYIEQSETKKSSGKLGNLLHLFRPSEEHNHDSNEGKYVSIPKKRLNDLIELIEVLWQINDQQSRLTSKYGEKTEEIIRKMLGVSENVVQESTTINDSYVRVNQIAESISQIAELAGDISGLMLDSSERVNGGNKSINEISEQMNNISKKITNLHDAVAEFNQQSQNIESMNMTITEIATQTNLLALNAAIEAARAGEHGLGFGIIADEVNKLSSQSSNASKQITSLINEVKKNMKSVIKEMEIGVEEVRKGMEVTSVAKEVFSKILTSVENVSKHVQDVSASTEEISASAELLDEALSDINEKSKNNAENATRVAQSVEGQTKIVVDIATLGQQSDEIIGEIKNYAKDFLSYNKQK